MVKLNMITCPVSHPIATVDMDEENGDGDATVELRLFHTAETAGR